MSTSPFSHFSFSEEDAKRAHEAAANEVVPDRSVCICGHPSMHHIVTSEHVICSSKRIYCPCSQLIPAIECEDLRFFGKVTRGEGANHALSLGIASSHFRKKWIRWIVQPVCMNCRREGVRMRPVPLDRSHGKKDGPGVMNVLACHECLI